MSKKRRSFKLSKQEKYRRKFGGASVTCPVCLIRIPACDIHEHFSKEHPEERLDVNCLTIGRQPNTNARIKSRKRITRVYGLPLSGGLPGLGKSR
jgi:hypothetical protein